MIKIWVSENKCYELTPAYQRKVGTAAEHIRQSLIMLSECLGANTDGIINAHDELAQKLSPGCTAVIMWWDGPPDWAEAYTVSEGGSGVDFTTFAICPHMLAIVPLQ